MAGSSQVPEFGKWDDGEGVQYTAYFDNATKAKSLRSNPNDPLHREEISNTVKSNYEQHKIREGVVVVRSRPQIESPLHRDASAMLGRDYDDVRPAKIRGQRASRPKHWHEDLSLEDGNTKKHIDSSLDYQTRGEVSFNSPLHPRQYRRTESKGGGVPSSPLRGSCSPRGGGSRDVIAPMTPGRSRQRSVPPGNETADRSVSVPKFGEWDESDPSSCENYSNIFTRVREERRTNVSHANTPNPSPPENSKKCCCFPWGK